MSQEHLRSEAWSAVTSFSEHAGRLQQGGKVTIDIGDDEKIRLKFQEEPAAVA